MTSARASANPSRQSRPTSPEVLRTSLTEKSGSATGENSPGSPFPTPKLTHLGKSGYVLGSGSSVHLTPSPLHSSVAKLKQKQ
jgi:hypothetical protein